MKEYGDIYAQRFYFNNFIRISSQYNLRLSLQQTVEEVLHVSYVLRNVRRRLVCPLRRLRDQ